MKYSIYGIFSNDTTTPKIYIGSAKNYNRRMGEHIRSVNNISDARQYNVKVYKIIRESGGLDNFNFQLLEEIEGSKEEASFREFHYFTLHNANMNTNTPARTSKESSIFYEKNNKNKRKLYRDTHKENAKLYRETHKETAKLYRETHKETAKLYRDTHKETAKLYRDTHKEEQQIANKKYQDKLKI